MKGMMDSKNRLAFEKGGLQVSVTIVYSVESVFHVFIWQWVFTPTIYAHLIGSLHCYVKSLEQWLAFHVAHL